MSLENDQVQDEPDPVQSLFTEAKTANEERRRQITIELGKLIREHQMKDFSRLLLTINLHGTMDVTGWSRAAIRRLLQVSRDSNTDTTVKHGERFLSPVVLPNDGPLLDVFVDAVMDGGWV